MIVAGIGCRKGSAAPSVHAALLAALRETGRALPDLVLAATLPARAGEPGLCAAAAALGLDLVVPTEAALRAAAGECLTDSPRARAAAGLPCVAEAAALAAAGPGARLLGPRSAVGGVTCALAEIAVSQQRSMSDQSEAVSARRHGWVGQACGRVTPAGLGQACQAGSAWDDPTGSMPRDRFSGARDDQAGEPHSPWHGRTAAASPGCLDRHAGVFAARYRGVTWAAAERNAQHPRPAVP